MITRRRLAFVVTWVATLVMVAAVAFALSGHGAAGPHRVVLQLTPGGDAASRRAADAAVASTTITTTESPVAAPTTGAPTTAPPATVAPPAARKAPAVTAAPRVTPPSAARPAVTAAPNPAPPDTTAAAPSSGGSAGDFTLIGYRWNPCSVITVGSTGPDISGIVSELASITGLHLQPVSGIAQITVQWGAVPAGGEIGLTAWRAVGGWLSLVGINIDQGAQPYMATVLRHELGHALGLGHAAHANEIMYPTAGHGSPTDYQAGDLAGLRKIGAAAGGC